MLPIEQQMFALIREMRQKEPVPYSARLEAIYKLSAEYDKQQEHEAAEKAGDITP
jgi:hypothetical protein